MNGVRVGLGLVSLTLVGIVAACGSNDTANPLDVTTSDAAADAGSVDSAAPPLDLGGDAACDDCAWFTTDCTPTTICKIGVELDPLAKLNAVTATDTDVWAVGASGLVIRHDGTEWSIKHLAEPDTMTQIIRRPAGGLWAIGGPLYAGPNAEDSSGSGFARTTLPVRGFISGLWGKADSTTAWAVGNSIYRIDAPEGGALSISDVPTYSLYTYGFTAGGINAIHGAPDGVLWGVGRIGGAYRLWDLDAPTPQTDALNTQTHATLYAVWAVEANDVWAVGDKGTIRHYAGHGRMWDIVESPVSSTLRAIWAGSATDIWAVGDAGVVLHYDGTSWQRAQVAGLGSQRPNLRAVWGTGSDRVFAVGDNVVLGLGPSSGGGVK